VWCNQRRPPHHVPALAGVLMLTTLSVVFLFALPYPKKAAFLKGTAVGRALNNYDWCPSDHPSAVCCLTLPR
jgi:hypothetical protein